MNNDFLGIEVRTLVVGLTHSLSLRDCGGLATTVRFTDTPLGLAMRKSRRFSKKLSALMCVFGILAACSAETTGVHDPESEGTETPALAVETQVQIPCTQCVFGPQVFIKSGVKPLTEISRFAAERTRGYVVDLEEGAKSPLGTVALNGEVLTVRFPGGKGAGHITQAMCLSSVTELAVTLSGGRGSSMTLAVVATSPSPVVAWGSDPFAADPPPSGNFVSLADGGVGQMLALRNDGTLYLSGIASDLVPEIPATMAGRRFIAVGLGRRHGMAIDTNGSISSWGLGSATAGAPETGRFVAVAGGGLHSVALDTAGRISMWGGADLGTDYPAVVGVGAPAGIRFAAIAARARYTLALGDDGNIYGWGVDIGVFNSVTTPWTSDGAGRFIAPFEVGNPYVAIAAGIDHITALRANGNVAMWDPTVLISPPPSGRVFKKIAAGLGYGAGIDQTGQVHTWADPAHAAFAAPPTGSYSAISAASGHAIAIAGPIQCPW